MPQRDKAAPPGPLREGALSSLPAVAAAPLATGYDRRRSTPQPATSGRCGFCGSHDTFSVSPQSFQEWALERWGDAALRRCHDCGTRQAVAGLGSQLQGDWRLSRGLLKPAAWVVAFLGAVMFLFMFLRNAERAPGGQKPFNLPRERPSPSAPAPSPPSGPFSLRSIPTSVA